MDDPDTYGPEFHQLPFSRAVEAGTALRLQSGDFLLCMSQTRIRHCKNTLVQVEAKINITDATKIIGSWRALQNPEGKI